MDKIQVLDQKVANMIAAGEVVERPASVVKELVENAIDANAQAITVEIKNGGIAYIRVSDNGDGIDKEDAVVAFERHATSKIHDAEDLNGIFTLGFRGEALASIAAVSHVELITKTSGADEGTHVVIKAGALLSRQDVGCPRGTTVLVKNLFYNTPARMKFLKKDATEASHIGDIINRMILGHPGISFRYINNGKEVVFTPGDNNLVSCIYSLYGKDYAKSMVPVKHSDQGIDVWGLAGKANIARANRSFQSFFINGRYIKSNTLTYAVQEAYKNMLTVNRFPVAVLHLKINPALIDVNVHPTKMEVKFSNEKQVFQAVYWAVKNALYTQRDIPNLSIGKKNIFEYSSSADRQHHRVQEAEPVQQKVKIVPPTAFRPTEAEKQGPAKQANIGSSTTSDQKIPYVKSIPEDMQSQIVKVSGEQAQKQGTNLNDHKVTDCSQWEEENRPDTVSDTGDSAPNAPPPTPHNFKIIGQVFNTYIIIEKDQEMLMIDQHAAHERLKYEQLLKDYQNRAMDSQVLLVPIVIQLSTIEIETVKANISFFEKIGFEVEDFGNNAIVIRQTPVTMDENAMKDLFLEFIALIQRSNKEAVPEMAAHALHTMACKAAIKANRVMHVQEMQALIKDILNLENINTCPHGRPIIISLSKYQIEKEFKRVGK